MRLYLPVRWQTAASDSLENSQTSTILLHYYYLPTTERNPHRKRLHSIQALMKVGVIFCARNAAASAGIRKLLRIILSGAPRLKFNEITNTFVVLILHSIKLTDAKFGQVSASRVTLYAFRI